MPRHCSAAQSKMIARSVGEVMQERPWSAASAVDSESHVVSDEFVVGHDLGGCPERLPAAHCVAFNAQTASADASIDRVDAGDNGWPRFTHDFEPVDGTEPAGRTGRFLDRVELAPPDRAKFGTRESRFRRLAISSARRSATDSLTSFAIDAATRTPHELRQVARPIEYRLPEHGPRQRRHRGEHACLHKRARSRGECRAAPSPARRRLTPSAVRIRSSRQRTQSGVSKFTPAVARAVEVGHHGERHRSAPSRMATSVTMRRHLFISSAKGGTTSTQRVPDGRPTPRARTTAPRDPRCNGPTTGLAITNSACPRRIQ